ncbi:MAG: DNA mismatch repair protein MutL [Flavobacteriales bacterium]|nr:DNA mismatch repair protein MutL [Flavobacteriales bacterium]
MKKKINILSSNVINQIAAGEVIQRPASVVKELLENSIDAKSKNIQIIIKNAGKTFIQVIDDGQGMNKEDAKICFKKHSTSKITKTEDILQISTMGFRGEALASIASVSEVELKTKTNNETSGTIIHVDNSKIKKVSTVATKTGTSLSVKNLFFNIPARKNFLKSDQIEMKHILEVFTQIAIANYNISFKLIHNSKSLYNIAGTNLKKRIIQIFGNRYNKKILPIEEETSIVSVNGFIGNPLDAKKTRGEQFLYVNNRFIKSAYLNHAIKNAMENIITKDHHPSYFIFLDISTQSVDVNVHPNKTEVKFEDEKAIYQIIQAAAKKSIGMNNIVPSLDFSIEKSFEIPVNIQNSLPQEPALKINTNFNPFNKKNDRKKENTDNLHKLFEEDDSFLVREIMNIDNRYAVFIMENEKSINIIDKKRAIERIKYEKTKASLMNSKQLIQLTIEPTEVSLNKLDVEILKENTDLIESLGYKIQEIKGGKIIFNSVPSDMKNSNTQQVIESFIEELKLKNTNIGEKLINQLSKKIAYNTSIRQENFNSSEKNHLKSLILELLKCKTPFIGINGNPCVINIETNKIFN